jgi:hypothetical protein
MPSSFCFRGLRCFVDARDPYHCDYLPLHADLRRDADHKPLLTLIDVGNNGYLLFTATWSASESDERALREELALRAHEPDPLRITLSFAPVVGTKCNALIADGKGAFRALATRRTSGIPPYDAVFNLWLQDEKRTQAQAALRGEPGFLGIEYLASIAAPVRAFADIGSLVSAASV